MFESQITHLTNCKFPRQAQRKLSKAESRLINVSVEPMYWYKYTYLESSCCCCWPLRFSTLIFAPLSISSCTTSGRELSMALIRGVAPLSATASMLAPKFSRYSTTSFTPQWHAKCNGVHLKLSWALTLALKKKHGKYSIKKGFERRHYVIHCN